MATTTFPESGTEGGSCIEPCAHKDCAQTRKDRATLCRHCDEAIESRPFYNVTSKDDPIWGNNLVHATCETNATKRRGDAT